MPKIHSYHVIPSLPKRIRCLIDLAYNLDEQLRRRVVFLEDYDLSVARYLVQGVDVWLNTPRRPMEASGTSGMKLLANGGLNLSILDGWWCEGYDPQTGWAIGSGEDYSDPEYQDQVESQALYNILEREVVPLYYDRQSDGLPRGWITKMKTSMKKLCPIFNTNRMVAEYTERFYLTAASRYAKLTDNGAQKAKQLVEWRSRVWPEWKQVGVEQVESHHADGITVGSTLTVKARVRLGTLSPKDVTVQIYQGLLDSNRQLQEGTPITMKLQMSLGNETYSYHGEIPCQQSGLCGFSVRVLPSHEDAILPYELPLIAWEEGTE